MKKFIIFTLILLGSFHMHVAYCMDKEPKKEPVHTITRTKKDFVKIFNEKILHKIEKRSSDYFEASGKYPTHTCESILSYKLHHFCLDIINYVQHHFDDLKIKKKEQGWAYMALTLDTTNTKHKNFDLEILLEHLGDFIKVIKVDPDNLYDNLCKIVETLDIP